MSAPQTVPVVAVPKFDLKHILVTTDFSDCSRMALKQAAAIARIHGSDLFVLHVVAPEPTINSALEPATWELEAIMASAKAEIRTAEQEEAVAAVPHHFLVESGNLPAILKAIIKEREIALLVLGTHGRTGIKKLILGSVAEEIFRIAPCPVLTIGPDVSPNLLTHGRFQSVLFATDFSAGSLHALPYAVAFAQESHARLTLAHVLEEGSVAALYLHEQLSANARKRLEEMVPVHSQIASPTDVEVVSGYPVEEILRIARKNQCDLIVLGVHKSSGVGAVTSAHLPWTIAQSVVCHAKCPVLTVRG